MTLAEREQQIIRVKSQSFQPELNEAVEQQLRTQVQAAVQTTLEAALVEEVEADRAALPHAQPRRSGFFQRILDTPYGRILRLRVPKLRWGNKQRQWKVLQRYQRSGASLLAFALCLYVMGLSVRDLQDALFLLLGAVVSTTAINRITLQVQQQLDQVRNVPLVRMPALLIVDGVWVEIQYPTDEVKRDRAGHARQCRHAQERVILAVLAVWPDGGYEMLHYEIALTEEEATWSHLFAQLRARGLDPQAVRLLVSDGSPGVLAAMAQHFPNAQLQRCITHKVRGMGPYLTYAQLPPQDSAGQPRTTAAAKAQRRQEIEHAAYAIYDAPSYAEAQQQLAAFVEYWQPLEPEAVHAFTWGIERTFTFYQFDPRLHLRLRTTNLLERQFREFRTRADEMGAFPNELSCLTVFFLVVERDHAKHDRRSMAKTL